MIGGTVFAFLQPRGDANPTGSGSTSPTPSVEPSSPEPSPSQTTLDPSTLGLTGITCAEAQEKVKAAKFAASNCVVGSQTAPSAADQGKVYDVQPRGNVPLSSTITLTTYKDITPLNAPNAAQLLFNGQQLSEAVAGTTVQVSLPTYQCASGAGNPSAYALTATNGQFSNGQSTFTVGSASQQVPLKVTGTANSNLVVTYTVTCTGGQSGDRTTDPSAAAQVPIIAAPAPSATPNP